MVKFLGLCLLVVSLWIAFGLSIGWNMWKWILVYWIIVAFRNVSELANEEDDDYDA